MDEKFKAHTLSGVTGTRNNHMHSIQDCFAELSAVQAANAALFGWICQLEEDLAAERTLNGNIHQLIFALFGVFEVAQGHFAPGSTHPRAIRIDHDLAVSNGI